MLHLRKCFEKEDQIGRRTVAVSDVMMNSIAVKLKESMNMSNRFADSKDREYVVVTYTKHTDFFLNSPQTHRFKNNDSISVFTPATVHDIDGDSWFDTTDEASVARVATQTSGQRPIGQQDDGYEYDVVLSSHQSSIETFS